MFTNVTRLSVGSCNCIGPQNNEPKCPCMMSRVIERDGRWIEIERDLGPVLQSPNLQDGE